MIFTKRGAGEGDIENGEGREGKRKRREEPDDESGEKEKRGRGRSSKLGEEGEKGKFVFRDSCFVSPLKQIPVAAACDSDSIPDKHLTRHLLKRTPSCPTAITRLQTHSRPLAPERAVQTSHVEQTSD